MRPHLVTVRFSSRTTAVSACYVKLSTKIRSNVLKAGYRMQDLFCDNNLWFRDFVITRNQVASHLVVIFWYVHVIYNFEYSSRDVFTVMFLLVAAIFKLSEVRQCKLIPKAHQSSRRVRWDPPVSGRTWYSQLTTLT